MSNVSRIVLVSWDNMCDSRPQEEHDKGMMIESGSEIMDILLTQYHLDEPEIVNIPDIGESVFFSLNEILLAGAMLFEERMTGANQYLKILQDDEVRFREPVYFLMNFFTLEALADLLDSAIAVYQHEDDFDGFLFLLTDNAVQEALALGFANR